MKSKSYTLLLPVLLTIIFCFYLMPYDAYAQTYKYRAFEEKHNITKLKLSADAKYITYLTAPDFMSGKSYVKIIDYSSMKVIFMIEGEICAFALTPDSKYLLSATKKGYFQLWEVANNKNLNTWEADKNCTDIVFSNDGCYYSVLKADWGINGPLKVYELSSHRDFFQFYPELVGVSNIHYSDDGTKIYCGSRGFIYVINSENGELLTSLPPDQKNNWYHGKLDCGIRYNSYMERIFSSNSQDENILIINPVTGDVENKISSNHHRYFVAYSFSPDYKYISFSLNNIIYMKSLETDATTQILNVKKSIGDFTIAADFSYGVGFSENTLYIVDIKEYSLDSKLYSENYSVLLNGQTEIYKTVTARGEFETLSQYYNRLNTINQKLYSGKAAFLSYIGEKKTEILQSANEKMDKINSQINESIRDTVISIQGVGKYDIDYQVLPVTINRMTRKIKLSTEDAKSLKENISITKVTAKKKLQYNLRDWEIYDIKIILPVNNTEIPFEN